MVRDRFDHNRGEGPDCIEHECIFVQDRGGYLILIPGDCESIPEAGGEAIAVAPDDVECLEANR